MTEEKQTYSFQAETKDLLDLMVNSLYTSKEIFLRELISNASDALDRLRLESLTSPELLESSNPEIRLDADKSARTLTISDNGIGMNRDEVVRNIGTIARSGTRELREKLRQNGSGESLSQLIGQFGVGFYSAFMVADHVTLLTRRAGEGAATCWESAGDGSYEISTAERPGHGTSITLHLKAVDTENGIEDFTDTWRLESIVKRYSDFVRYPIVLKHTREEVERNNLGVPVEGAKPTFVVEDKILNSRIPLWTRSQLEVTESEYHEFYRQLTHDYQPPSKTLVLKAEGVNEFHALLFIPSHAPHDLHFHAPDTGLRLFARTVVVVEKTQDLLPRYLRFVRGVVDAADLPLNISRQHLQQDRHLKQIRNWLTKKLLDAIGEMRKDLPEYLKFWNEFGRALKEGIGTDFDNKDRIVPLLLFQSSNHPESLTSLEEYIGRMKEGQSEVLYISAESRAIAENSPHLEAMREQGYEVLYLTDPVDEFLLQYLPEFQGKRLKSAVKGKVDLGTAETRKETEEQVKQVSEQFSELLSALQKILDGDVKQARISTRLKKSPACLVVDEHEYSPQLERLLMKGKGGGTKQRRVLEVNPDHPAMQRLRDRLQANPSDPAIEDTAHLLLGLALLAEGSELTDPARFSRSATVLLERVL